MLFVVALFIAFVSAEYTELVEEHMIGARYTETHDRHRNLFSVTRLDEKTIGLDAILQAKMFQDSEGDVFIGTSMYNNYVTYNGALPVLKWEGDDDGDEDGWTEVSAHPTVRTSGLDAQSAISYFNTKDGATWAYDALYAYQNNTVRRTNLIGGNGSSYIFKFDGESFEGTPTFTFFTNFSTSRSAYFETSDGREFLWTFSWGPANAPNPVPGARTPIVSDNRNSNPQRCSLLEYKGDSWAVAELNFIGCPTRPRSPISFANVNNNWVYLFPSFGAGAVLTLNYRPGSNPQWEVTNDVLDGFAIPDADTLYHWVDESDLGTYDMITAKTLNSVRTYRLHWDTHFVEELPAVPVSQGAPYDISFFEPKGRKCFVIGSATYPGLRDISPEAVHNYYTSIYCWDQSRDTWDLAIKFPAEWTWFNQVFTDPEDEEHFYLVTMSRAHLTSVNVKTYHLRDEDDDDVHIEFWEGPSVSYAEQARRDAHENRHISIATLSFVAFTLLLVLIMVFLSMSGGGGGGSGDYTSFNN